MNPNATKSHESLLTGTGINQHYLFLIEQVFNYLTLLVIFSLLGHTSTVDVGHKLLEVSRMTLIYRKLVLISSPPRIWTHLPKGPVIIDHLGGVGAENFFWGGIT